MAHWLLKSEPAKYSWLRLVTEGRTHWDGVRNFQASSNLKAMREGEEAFFYHSNEGLEIVGIVRIAKEYYPDPSDESGRFGMVDVAPARPVPRPVNLKQIKADQRLRDFGLVRQSRLSVVPVGEAEWRLICTLGGVSPD